MMEKDKKIFWYQEEKELVVKDFKEPSMLDLIRSFIRTGKVPNLDTIEIKNDKEISQQDKNTQTELLEIKDQASNFQKYIIFYSFYHLIDRTNNFERLSFKCRYWCNYFHAFSCRLDLSSFN